MESAKKKLQKNGCPWFPSFGFAWRPFGAKTFVVRGGYGIFYETVTRQPTFFGPPFIVSEPSYTNPTNVKDPGFVQWPLAFPQTTRLAGVTLPVSVSLDFRTPYSQNWNFTLEKEIAHMGVRVSYVGTGGRKLPYNFNLNQPAVGPGFYIDKPRPFPNLQTIRETRNGSSHTYHGLNLEMERRMYQGLTFQTAFTFAKNLGNDVTPENAFDLARERAQTPLIPFRRWVGYLIYEFPFGKAMRGALGHAVRGWQLGMMFATQDGQNETPVWTMSDIHGIQPTSSRTPALVAYRPDCLHDPNLPTEQRSIDAWYDVNAFRMPSTPEVFGTCGRSVIRGPGVRNMNASAYKVFSIAERYKIRIGMQATNVWNHPNFSNLTTTALSLDSITSRAKITGAGGATSDTVGDIAGPRALRLDLRIDF